MANYDPIRTRVLEGIKETLQSVSKYAVKINDEDQKGSSEFILLSIEDSVTIAKNAGSHTKRVKVNIEYHNNDKPGMTDSNIHMMDVLQDLLERNATKRSSAGVHQYFDAEVSNTDTEPTDEDSWVFMFTYDVSHSKVYN